MKNLFDEIPYLNGARIVLRELTESDAGALRGPTENETAYRYLPTFLFERKYADAPEVIRRMRDECFAPKESLILGIFRTVLSGPRRRCRRTGGYQQPTIAHKWLR